MNTGRGPQIALGAFLLLALTFAGPRPTALLPALQGTGGPASPEPLATLVAAVALLAWALTGWLVVVVALLLLSRLPGAAGALATRVVRRTAPAVVRRALQAGLGLGLSVSVLATTASPAAAEHGGLHVHVGVPGSSAALPLPAVAGEPLSLDWPQAAATVETPDLDWPKEVAPPAAPQDVTVRPGDSLWRLAATRLPENASDARIARTWPSWWAANRGVIGADPDLLHPGTRLTAPPALP